MDEFPIENYILRASEMWTASEFQTMDRTELPQLLNGHSLTHIKIYNSSINIVNQQVLSSDLGSTEGVCT